MMKFHLEKNPREVFLTILLYFTKFRGKLPNVSLTKKYNLPAVNVLNLTHSMVQLQTSRKSFHLLKVTTFTNSQKIVASVIQVYILRVCLLLFYYVLLYIFGKVCTCLKI